MVGSQVYIVMWSAGGGDSVSGVFLSLDAAQKYMDLQKSLPANKYLSYWIDDSHNLQS